MSSVTPVDGLSSPAHRAVHVSDSWLGLGLDRMQEGTTTFLGRKCQGRGLGIWGYPRPHLTPGLCDIKQATLPLSALISSPL